jgi:hypothetical protein
MKSRLLLKVSFILLAWPLGLRAQLTVPPDIKARFIAMPERVAQVNREGIRVEPYFVNHWYKGNTHCHSDTDGERMPRHGDGPPKNTLNWYADHGYDFVVFTDHNFFHQGLEAPEGLLYIKGEEITSMKYHVNALGIRSYIRPAFGEDKLTIYQRAIDDTLVQGGIPVINHPVTPLGYCFPEEFKQLENVHHFEVRNMQPGNYNQLAEPLWDNLLTDGYVFYGMITDDAHKFVHKNPLIGDPPGGGWIMVDAPECTQPAILEAIRAGRFYGSTGVKIKQYRVSQEAIQIWVDTNKPCLIEFIGDFGRVLHSGKGDYASYQPRGEGLYVRTRVTDPEGEIALMQPVFYR